MNDSSRLLSSKLHLKGLVLLPLEYAVGWGSLFGI